MSNVTAQKGPECLNHSSILNMLLSGSLQAPKPSPNKSTAPGKKMIEYPLLNYSSGNFLILTHYVRQVWSTLISAGEEIIESKFKKC